MFDREINELEEKLKKVKNKKDEYDKLDANKKLAILLHSKLCKGDHTERCYWYYFVDENGYPTWEKEDHLVWLKKANNLLEKGFNSEQIEAILDIIL